LVSASSEDLGGAGITGTTTGIFRGGKGPLSRLLSEHWCRRTSQGKYEQNGQYKASKGLSFKLS